MIEEIENELYRRRRPIEELVFSSIGTRKMQILKLPVDDQGWAFEFSLTKEEMVLSRSIAWLKEDGPWLKGYEPLLCPTDALKGIFSKLTNFTMPYFLPHLNVAGVGGISYEITIWGGIYQSITLRWWGDAPGAGWNTFTDLVLENISFFESLPIDPKLNKWWEK